MPQPTRTVVGTYTNPATQAAATGRLIFSTLPAVWTDAADGEILTGAGTVQLVAGALSRTLVTTDAAGVEPATGRYWVVEERIDGQPYRRRVFQLPAGAEIKLASIISADPAQAGYTPVEGPEGPAGPEGPQGPQGPQPPLGVAGAGADIALRSTDPTTTNARTPAVHAASHASGGTDPLTPAAIGAETPAGATTKVSDHAAAADPHGDRAWATSQFYPLASGNALNGFLDDALLRITDLETRATALEAETRTAVKTADETVTASTTLQDDDHLVLSVVANGWYEVSLFIDTEGDPAGDLTMGWTIPAGAALSWTEAGVSAGNTNNIGSVKLGRNDGATSSGVGIIAAGSVVLPRGVLRVSSTAGNIQFRWAQTAAAGTTTIKTGSMLKLTRVA